MDQFIIYFRRAVLFFQSLNKLVNSSFVKYKVALVMTFLGALIGVFIGAYYVSSSKAVYADSNPNRAVVESSLSISDIKPIESEVKPVDAARQKCLEISGAVKAPGVYCRDESSYLNAYIDLAGGFDVQKYAKDYVGQRINLASKPAEGSKVYIPYAGEVICKLVIPDINQSPNYPGGSVNYDDDYTVTDDEVAGEDNIDDDQENPIDPNENPDEGNSNEVEDKCDGLIGLNKAPIDALMTLPGIGESTAKKIIEARPFTAIENLLDVSGIGESKYNSLKDLVCID